MLENLEKIKEDLEKILYESGEIVKAVYMQGSKISAEADRYNFLTTDYDITVNDLLIRRLRDAYSHYSIISEELPDIDVDSLYSFVVDPIDGTRNFVRGIPVFFIGISLVEEKRSVLSMTYNPITSELFYAIKGKGAFLNGQPIKVGDRGFDVSDICIRTLPDKELQKQVVSNIIGNVHQVKNNMCSHDEISGVACNRYDGFVSKHSSPWDYCQYLLVEEAGGMVTDWNGEEFDISKDNIVVSNGIIHSELLKATKDSVM